MFFQDLTAVEPVAEATDLPIRTQSSATAYGVRSSWTMVRFQIRQ